jgi:hypothetical protein
MVSRRGSTRSVHGGESPAGAAAAAALSPCALPAPWRLRLSPVLPAPSWIEWLCLLGGLLLVMQYAWVMDDAFVYFRYVDNALFLKIGLVYNLGEYVEGYTSPLWTLLLLALRATGLGYWTIVRAIGLIAFALFWLSLVVLNRRMSPGAAADGDARARAAGLAPVVALPLCYLASNYGVLANFTSGLETPLVLLAGVVYALFLTNPTSCALQFCLALSPLVRPELAAPLLLCWALAWRTMRRFPRWMTAWIVTLNGAWLGFRIVYYADLLPNTWYLKNVTDWKQGWLYWQDTAGTYWLSPVLLALVAMLAWSWRGAAALRLAPRLLMLAAAATVLLHVVRVGGDHRHFRFLAFPFTLIVAAGSGIAEQFTQSIGVVGARRGRIVATLLSVAALAAAGLQYPPQLSRHPLLGQGEHHIVNKIEDRAIHRYHADLSVSPWSTGAKIDAKPAYRELKRIQGEVHYTGVSTSLWCVALYKDPANRAVHLLGLTDPILARVDMPMDRPSHKLGLQPLALDIAQLMRRYHVGGPPSTGLYEQAVQDATAPLWMVYNLDKIHVIERKEYNRHRLGENLRLALTGVGRLEVR